MLETIQDEEYNKQHGVMRHSHKFGHIFTYMMHQTVCN